MYILDLIRLFILSIILLFLGRTCLSYFKFSFLYITTNGKHLEKVSFVIDISLLSNKIHIQFNPYSTSGELFTHTLQKLIFDIKYVSPYFSNAYLKPNMISKSLCLQLVRRWILFWLYTLLCKKNSEGSENRILANGSVMNGFMTQIFLLIQHQITI